MSATTFEEAYERIVLGRAFNEYRDYYVQARARYARTMEVIGALGLPRGARHLDVGGGQMALLTRELYGFEPVVGDVVATAAGDVADQGLGFQRLNLMDEAYDAGTPYDLITLCEVIEHIQIGRASCRERVFPVV